MEFFRKFILVPAPLQCEAVLETFQSAVKRWSNKILIWKKKRLDFHFSWCWWMMWTRRHFSFQTLTINCNVFFVVKNILFLSMLKIVRIFFKFERRKEENSIDFLSCSIDRPRKSSQSSTIFVQSGSVIDETIFFYLINENIFLLLR